MSGWWFHLLRGENKWVRSNGYGGKLKSSMLDAQSPWTSVLLCFLGHAPGGEEHCTGWKASSWLVYPASFQLRGTGALSKPWPQVAGTPSDNPSASSFWSSVFCDTSHRAVPEAERKILDWKDVLVPHCPRTNDLLFQALLS